MTEFFSQCSVDRWCQIGVGLFGLICYIGFIVGIGKFCAGATGKGWKEL